jgi:soluble cytochrome b562
MPLYAKFLLVLVLILVGIGIGFRIEQPKIEKLNEQLGQVTAAYKTLAATAQEQNSAIQALNVAADKRESVAKVAVEQAKKNAVVDYQHAQQILIEQIPVVENVCTAASQAFSNELNLERGFTK